MSIPDPSGEPAAESVTARIVSAVASRKGVDPTAVDEPLYDVVDPDALEALVASGADADLRVTFEYSDCVVTVDGTGRVSVAAGERVRVTTADTLADMVSD